MREIPLRRTRFFFRERAFRITFLTSPPYNKIKSLSLPLLHLGSSFCLLEGSHDVLQTNKRAQDESKDTANNEQNVPDKDELTGSELIWPQDTHLDDTGEGNPEGGQTECAEQGDEQLQTRHQHCQDD
ncbi:uncharacterized protein LOC108254272 [Diaphorina citri]|uniref:Uncharacterized protein LOC108254272 n=1 Tax=Diaphorina citri TaxID=121845 RepID=A0A1S4ERU5_DIACI|nr:uncharacterized protein LOC108254272 [Diaphorina citri]